MSYTRAPRRFSGPRSAGHSQGRWWRGLDSNQRRRSQRIYSPSPLATRAPLHDRRRTRSQNESAPPIKAGPSPGLSSRGPSLSIGKAAKSNGYAFTHRTRAHGAGAYGNRSRRRRHAGQTTQSRETPCPRTNLKSRGAKKIAFRHQAAIARIGLNAQKRRTTTLRESPQVTMRKVRSCSLGCMLSRPL